MKVKILRLTETAKLPEYANPGDIGADIFSDQAMLIAPRSRAVVKTGISLGMPQSFKGYARIAPRSGLGSRGIDVAAGVIDRGYVGEVGVILVNTTQNLFEVKAGDKIAQIIFELATTGVFSEVVILKKTKRGKKGFGSSG